MVVVYSFTRLNQKGVIFFENKSNLSVARSSVMCYHVVAYIKRRKINE